MSKILIIDDDPDIVESMRVVLESKGYKIDAAENGKKGLEKIRVDKPDLIILDVMMESLDRGFEVARELKKDKNYKDIPILMLTAIKERVGLDFRSEAGDEVWLPVDDYVEKPLRSEELLLKVKALLGKKSS